MKSVSSIFLEVEVYKDKLGALSAATPAGSVALCYGVNTIGMMARINMGYCRISVYTSGKGCEYYM